MTARPRIALAGVFHESNTFVARPTTLERFRGAWHEGADLIEALTGTQTVMGGAIAAGTAGGFELVPALHAWATPAGTVAADAFARLEMALTRALRALGPVDGLLLELHGALVADGVAAADARLARAARAAVGEVPTVCVLDPHANVAPGLVEAVDVVLAYRTNPHVDMAEAGERGVAVLEPLLTGGVQPVQAMIRVPVVAPAIAQATADQPLAALLDEARRLEAQDGVLAATLAFGFAHADVPELGMTALVATDGDPAAARRLAAELATAAWARREEFRRALATPGQAVERAAQGPGLTGLADTGDNVGGGAPGDSTVLARAVLEHGGLRAATTICDPDGVAAAATAGAGASIEITVGSPPLPLAATVRAIVDGRYVNDGPLSAGVEFDMGRVAVLEAGPLVVVLQSTAVMANDQNMLRSVGVDLGPLDAVVLKGAAAVRAGWRSAVERFVDVGTPGATTSDLGSLRYVAAARPLWPFDDVDWRP
jgi:microcystin degradation protein MlrC